MWHFPDLSLSFFSDIIRCSDVQTVVFFFSDSFLYFKAPSKQDSQGCGLLCFSSVSVSTARMTHAFLSFLFPPTTSDKNRGIYNPTQAKPVYIHTGTWQCTTEFEVELQPEKFIKQYIQRGTTGNFLIKYLPRVLDRNIGHHEPLWDVAWKICKPAWSHTRLIGFLTPDKELHSNIRPRGRTTPQR